MQRHPFRVLWRLSNFLFFSVAALTDFLLRYKLGGRLSYRDRANWTHYWAPRFLRFLHIELSVRGKAPTEGVLVANHLSYLDILILSASQPLVFLSKSEVRSWPLIGVMVQCAGTLFVNRRRKMDVASVAQSFAPVVSGEVVLTLFPEGTSTGGDQVLPFMPSLLEPAAANGWPVTPAHLSYHLDNGSASDEVCYWRDMTFFPHLLNLLSKEKIYATVNYGPELASGLDRKQMAKVLHERVCAMAAHTGQKPRPVPAFV